MDLTIKEFADQYGANKQTINNRLKRLEDRYPKKRLRVNKNGKFRITPAGVELLKEDLKKNPISSSGAHKVKGPPKSIDNRVIEVMANEIETLTKRIEELEATNKRLMDLMDKQIDSFKQGLNESHILTLKSQENAMQEKPKRKKSLASKIAIASKVLLGGYD